MAFFSGYPLLYTLIFFLAGSKVLRDNFKERIVSLLPISYALMGTLYLGLQLKNLYPDYSVENIKLSIQQPYLITWGLLSILFWIPAIARKKVLSLLHSLIFFLFLITDLLLQLTNSSAYMNNVANDMNVYTTSLLLNLISFGFIVLLSYLFSRYKIRSAT